MSNPTKSTEITIKTKEELPSFIIKKHELQNTLKLILSGNEKYVKYLQDTLDDEKADAKLKANIALDLRCVMLSFWAVKHRLN